MKTTSHTPNSLARSLAEAVILQSIEDLWNPERKRESLKFFKSNGFELCSKIAGISYIKQLAMLRMLARGCRPKNRFTQYGKGNLSLKAGDVRKKLNISTTRSLR